MVLVMSQTTLNDGLIKFVCPPSLKSQLQKLAEARNISLSALVRLILTEYVKTKG